MDSRKQTIRFPALVTKSHIPHLSPLRSDRLVGCKEKHDKDNIYLVKIRDGGNTEYTDGLFRYNLVDEIELYLLPLSYGNGIPLTGKFRAIRWKLLDSETFSNDICQLMYGRNG